MTQEQMRAAALDRRKWVLREDDAAKLESAWRPMHDLRILLEFKEYTQNPDLPVACSEEPFTKKSNAGSLDPTKASVLTVRGMST